MKAVLLLILFVTATLAEYTSYEGYTAYTVTPTNEKHVIVLEELYKADIFDFWSKSKALNHPVTIMVSPDLKNTFTSAMENNDLDYSVLIENVETVVAAEREQQSRASRVQNGRISFDAYQRYDTILAYMDTLAAEYPDIVSLEEYGTSYEGRPLRLIRLGSGEGKPTIFIEGGIHAREWIAPALVLYVLQQLVETEDNRSLLENANWIIIPVTNPDGYEFSHTNTRMWRKTRSIGTICNGVDGNRNFDLAWGGLGTSTSQCSEIYIGRYPFSEPETAALARVALATDVDLYLAVHSFGNWILYPWGYTYDVPDNVDELHAVGDLAAEAIASVAGTRYVVGNSALLLYFAAGCSDDWFKGAAGAPLSYTLELPGGGNQGFDLPPSRIQPVVEETWPGIVAYYEYVVNNYKK